MSGGGGSKAPTTQTVNQTNLPEYARPYFERMMNRTEAASNRPYTLYEGPRIASFNQDQQAGFDVARGLSGNSQPAMTQSTGLAAAAGAQAPSQYQAGTYTPTNVNAGQMGPAGVFDSSAAQQYMNPFLSTVLDQQLARANTRFGEQRLNRNAAAARSGVFGGYRQGVEEAIAERDYNTQLNEIEGNAMFQAFQNAQEQYERDRQARFGVERTNIDNTLRADLANQAQGLSAFQANQGAQQQQEQLRQGGLGTMLQAGSQLAQTAGQQQSMDLARMEALRSVGLQQQQQDQASLDLAHQDFLNQQNWDLNQLNFLSSILRGVPITSSNTVSQYENPNPYSQMLGLGLNGVALANAIGGGGA